MTITTTEQQQLQRAIDDLYLSRKVHYLAIGTGVVVWVQSERHYVIYEEGKTPWWTNDLPLVVPEVLTPEAAAIRAEKLSKCKGAGKCFPWCTEKRAKAIDPEPVVEEEEDA